MPEAAAGLISAGFPAVSAHHIRSEAELTAFSSSTFSAVLRAREQSGDLLKVPWNTIFISVAGKRR
jgi:hypothetical protein